MKTNSKTHGRANTTSSRRPVGKTKTSKQRRYPGASIGAWTLASVMMSFLGACGPEMDPASLVEKTRVVGARVEVTGESDRASPRPGETAKVSWLVTAPAEVPPLGWAFVLCPGAAAGCEAPLAVFQGHERVPAVDIAVPAADALGGARELVLFGRVCSASEPVIGAGGQPGCTMNGDGTTAVLSIPLQMAETGNRNPSLAATTATFDKQAWGAGEDCASLPTVKAGTEDHALEMDTDGNDRERFTAMIGDPAVPTPQREALQISQFTTAGKLERSYSTVESTDVRERPTFTVKWKAPDADKVPAEGLVVRFTFVARDLRGGVDWTSRAVCVTK